MNVSLKCKKVPTYTVYRLYMITGKCLFSDPKCSITTDTKPPIAVATKGMNKDHALEEAIKLVVYHLQISCGQLS